MKFIDYPSPELIQHTIQVWEPRLGRKLTEEDARRILTDVVGFFKTLAKWDRESEVRKRKIAGSTEGENGDEQL